MHWPGIWLDNQPKFIVYINKKLRKAKLQKSRLNTKAATINQYQDQ